VVTVIPGADAGATHRSERTRSRNGAAGNGAIVVSDPALVEGRSWLPLSQAPTLGPPIVLSDLTQGVRKLGPLSSSVTAVRTIGALGQRGDKEFRVGGEREDAEQG